MKTFTFIISILLVSFIICDDCSSKKNPSGYKDCKDLKVEGDDKYCCYIHSKFTFNGEDHEDKECDGLTQAEYDKIEEDVKKGKKEAEDMGYKNIKYDINCNSSYLQYLSTLLLLLIL